ncbi:MAG: PhoU domain-containing protein [Pseudomonadota bacterium]
MTHYEQRLQQDLDRIKRRVASLGGLVKNALDDAVRALLTGNEPLAHMTVLRDGPINRKTRAIDDLCHQFIAVHLPSAGLLRLVSTIIRANIALERIGDYAVTICRESMQLGDVPRNETASELEELADKARIMLSQAIDALNAMDAELAHSTIQNASNLQRELEAVYDSLIDNERLQDRGELIAVFVVFNMLKRVADQAKNLCEETIFAATGETKPDKTYKIVFVDRSHRLVSRMAEAIARKNYTDRCEFASAGSSPAGDVHPALSDFLDQHSIDVGDCLPRAIDDGSFDLTRQHVVVSVAGPIRSHVQKLPFHTTALEWDIGPEPDAAASAAEVQQRLEEIYRELAVQIRDLIELLSGPDAD